MNKFEERVIFQNYNARIITNSDKIFTFIFVTSIYEKERNIYLISFLNTNKWFFSWLVRELIFLHNMMVGIVRSVLFWKNTNANLRELTFCPSISEVRGRSTWGTRTNTLAYVTRDTSVLSANCARGQGVVTALSRVTNRK